MTYSRISCIDLEEKNRPSVYMLLTLHKNKNIEHNQSHGLKFKQTF